MIVISKSKPTIWSMRSFMKLLWSINTCSILIFSEFPDIPDNFSHKKVGQRSRKLVKSGCNKEFFNSIFTVDTLRAELVIKFLARSIKREGLLEQLHFYMIELLYFIYYFLDTYSKYNIFGMAFYIIFKCNLKNLKMLFWKIF